MSSIEESIVDIGSITFGPKVELSTTKNSGLLVLAKDNDGSQISYYVAELGMPGTVTKKDQAAAYKGLLLTFSR